jgi:hypothetical protein
MLETGKGIKINFFFRKGEQFPWAIDFENGAESFNARLSDYNQETEQYSVTFEMNGEYASASGLVLNKKVLNCYVDDLAMNEIQNTRMREIYTALGLYVSLGQLFSGDNDLVFRGFWSSVGSFFKKVGKSVLTGISLTAMAIATILVLPPVVSLASVISPTLAAALPVMAKVMGAIGVAAGALALLIPDAEDERGNQGSPDTPVSTQPPSVVITLNGSSIPDDPKYIYQFGAAGDEKVFDISFVNYPAQPRILLYEPETKRYIMYLNQGNAHYLEIRNESGQQLQGAGSTFYLNSPSDKIKVKRNGNNGRADEGKLYLLIDFGTDVLINGSYREVDDFYLPNGTNDDATLLSPREMRRFYVLRFQIPA